jgi:hypothetical protein
MDFFILYRLEEDLLGSGVEGDSVGLGEAAVAAAATPVMPMASLRAERREMSLGVPHGAVSFVFMMGIEWSCCCVAMGFWNCGVLGN